MTEPFLFSTGPVTYALGGTPALADEFRQTMLMASCADGKPDIVFEFVPDCPPWQSTQYVQLDDFAIAPGRMRMKDRLFTIELQTEGDLFRARVASASGNPAKRLQRTVKKTWRYFHTHGSRASLHHLKRFVYYIYMPILELALLRKGATLAHSSAIEKNGKAILFPAWGGVGKTSIMSIYLDHGWKFLSDDTCIIQNDGTAHLHPLPMHIYKYHQFQCSGLVDNMLQSGTPLDRLLWRLLSPLKDPERLVRWIGPDRVFGEDKISTSGTIAGVFHLHRVKALGTFMLEPVSPQTMGRLMASTLMDEINNLVAFSVAVNSVLAEPFFPDIGEIFHEIAGIYANAFTQAPCSLISLPESSTASDLHEFMKSRALP